MTPKGSRTTTWSSVFRGPHLFGVLLLIIVAVVALAEGLLLVTVFTLLLLVGEALLFAMRVRGKYERGWQNGHTFRREVIPLNAKQVAFFIAIAVLVIGGFILNQLT